MSVFSVEKDDNDEGNAKVDFGVTTPDEVETQKLTKAFSIIYRVMHDVIFSF